MSREIKWTDSEGGEVLTRYHPGVGLEVVEVRKPRGGEMSEFRIRAEYVRANGQTVFRMVDAVGTLRGRNQMSFRLPVDLIVGEGDEFVVSWEPLAVHQVKPSEAEEER